MSEAREALISPLRGPWSIPTSKNGPTSATSWMERRSTVTITTVKIFLKSVVTMTGLELQGCSDIWLELWRGDFDVLEGELSQFFYCWFMIVLCVIPGAPRFFSLQDAVCLQHVQFPNFSNFVWLLKSVSKKRQMPALGIHLLAIRRSTGCPVGRVGKEIEPQGNYLLQVERARQLIDEV